MLSIFLGFEGQSLYFTVGFLMEAYKKTLSYISYLNPILLLLLYVNNSVRYVDGPLATAYKKGSYETAI